MSKRPVRFHCKSEKQKNTIAGKCARRAKQQGGQQQNVQQSSKVKKTVSDTANKITQAKPPFRLPLSDGEHCWNIYRVPNFILNGCQDNDVHGGLVLNELNNKVMLVEVTHSKKRQGRNTIDIRNLRKDDLDENGNLKESHLVRRLLVSIETNDGEKAIDISALKKKLNDSQFEDKEKEDIITQLSHLSTAEERYKKFLELANKKD